MMLSGHVLAMTLGQWIVLTGGGPRQPVPVAATLREQWDSALLYRSLARLRTAEDGVAIPQSDAEELRWRGVPRAGWVAFCDRWALTGARTRPHRWVG